jgi:hypothetical protein
MRNFILIILTLIITGFPEFTAGQFQTLKCRRSTNVYDSCNLSHITGRLNRGAEVVVFSDTCNSNNMEWTMINVSAYISEEIKLVWINSNDFEFTKPITDSVLQLAFARPFNIWKIAVTHKTSETSGIRIELDNNSDKTIKKIKFIIVPYNSGGGIVKDAEGKSSKPYQYTNPIHPKSRIVCASEVLFFSTSINHYFLKDISVQYTDNTIEYFKFEEVLIP